MTDQLSGSKTNLAAGGPRGSNPNLSNAPSRPKTVSVSGPPGGGDGGPGLAGLAGGMAGASTNVEKAAEAGQRVYENTYKMAPDRKFPTEVARKLTSDILERRLTKVTYSAEKAADLSKAISGDIIQGLKALGLDRYKFVADVTIGEFKGQGIRNASRALWDPSTDSFTSATFKNASLFCVAVVFGVYFE
ncbi:hypothetical protein H9P43_003653 [Blastocladiella emersonii ATCC 22665]|nr:hypothetical protein H9P43_003653 [Blastocladiella emersonii ATCC 22665]